MRQSLFKAISCIALIISVFFCSPYVALADESSVDWTGSFNYGAQTCMMVNFSAPNNLPSSTAYSGVWGGSSNVHIQMNGVKVGYSYTGMCYFDIKLERKYTSSSYLYGRINLSVSDVNVPDGVNLAFVSSFQDLSDISDKPYLRVYFYFDDFYIRASGTPTFSFTLNAEQAVTTSSGDGLNYYYLNPSNAGYNIEYAGSIVETLVNVDPNVGDVVYMGEQQMQQQQQIADQQAQQSQQQHEDLKNGFTDNTYNNNVSNAGSQVDSYIDLEHNLLEQQNQQMCDYADSAFNLNTLSPYINAIALTSTFFTWIWNGFGELSVVFVIVLAIGVACLILGIRRRG